MHWLSYSHADQALLRSPELEETWDALVVPGTLAAFYFEGTGGFVLTRNRPYVIDPRTPVLQQIDVKRPEPRKSHLALAAIHDSELSTIWPDSEVPVAHWQDGRWSTVVDNVLSFQKRYSESATAKIDKYSRLLAEATGQSPAVDLEPPHRLVPPYWAVGGVEDPWWHLSREAIEIGLKVTEDAPALMPILATTSDTPIGRFADLIMELPDACGSVFCWRGAWDEATADEADIEGWAETLTEADRHGIAVTNLYGGYLSVLLMSLGLRGLGHGVGYSEQRDTRRLGETGAPPTRYYVPALRTFVPRASAQPAVDALPIEWACKCSVCDSVTEHGVPIVDALSVEDLKRHFLICRNEEIRRVRADINQELDEATEVALWLQNRSLPGVIPSAIGERLALWVGAIQGLL